MDEKIRTFIAINLPDPVLGAIAGVQETLKRSGLKMRWVRREGMHLTLKFLGDIDRNHVEDIRGAMERSTRAFSPFTLRGEGVGVFPDFTRPRVAWVGVSGDIETLRSLQRELDSQLNGLGFEKEKRPFKGHLTLGRVKGSLDRTRLKEALFALEDFSTQPFEVKALILFQSDLRPDGAVYTRLAEAPLKSP